MDLKYLLDRIINELFPRLKRNGVNDPKTIAKAHELLTMQSDDNIQILYEQLKYNPLIKWKESIKKVVGLEVETDSDLDS